MRLILAATVLMCATACGSDDTPAGGGAKCNDPYCDDAMWLCRPGKVGDFCAEVQTATVVMADGTRSERTLTRASNPPIDCFYVYPTVALSGAAGNVEDFSNLEDIKVPVRSQAAPFSEVCAVYAPLYHQIRFATYSAGDPTPFLEKAYEDVAAAFRVFLDRHSKGRDFVLMGHSQGSHMTRRLLQREIETNDALRARLVVAMPIGPVGDITIAKGEVVGGSFSKLPLCTTAAERGCVVTYDSHPAGGPSLTTISATAGMDRACANPAAPGPNAGPVRLSAATFPTSKNRGQFGSGTDDGLATTFAVFPNLFTGECKLNAAGFSYYEIAFAPQAGDQRMNPLPFAGGIVDALGLHVSDYGFLLPELIGLVKTKSQR